jgi:hypothetical protein
MERIFYHNLRLSKTNISFVNIVNPKLFNLFFAYGTIIQSMQTIEIQRLTHNQRT